MNFPVFQSALIDVFSHYHLFLEYDWNVFVWNIQVTYPWEYIMELLAPDALWLMTQKFIVALDCFTTETQELEEHHKFEQ